MDQVWFHYRADVPLGFFDPLDFRKIRYSSALTQRVLVFNLPSRGFEQRKWRENRTRSIKKELQGNKRNNTNTE